jgi:hypothetical protein
MQFQRMVTAAVLAASLLMTGTLPVAARDRDDKCEKRVRRAEERLHDAERKHGEHSRQAEKRRQDLERERSGCRTDRDRDRDHDRDRR